MEILPILKAFKLLSSFKNSFWITLPNQLHCWKIFHPVCDRSSVLLILYFEEYKFLISSPHMACTSLSNSPVAHCTGDESETQVGHILCPGHPVRHCLRQVLSSIHWIPKKSNLVFSMGEWFSLFQEGEDMRNYLSSLLCSIL